MTPVFVSHGATKIDGSREWFIVEPRDNPWAEVEALRNAGRDVVRIDYDGFNYLTASVLL